MRALITAVIYFGSFLAIGVTAKVALGKWMKRKGADLSDIQAQATPNRRKRRVFLLGVWRDED
jgi:hypothetical protein